MVVHWLTNSIYILKFQGCPSLLQSDPGTENVLVGSLQSLFVNSEDGFKIVRSAFNQVNRNIIFSFKSFETWLVTSCVRLKRLKVHCTCLYLIFCLGPNPSLFHNTFINFNLLIFMFCLKKKNPFNMHLYRCSRKTTCLCVFFIIEGGSIHLKILTQISTNFLHYRRYRCKLKRTFSQKSNKMSNDQTFTSFCQHII